MFMHEAVRVQRRKSGRDAPRHLHRLFARECAILQQIAEVRIHRLQHSIGERCTREAGVAETPDADDVFVFQVRDAPPGREHQTLVVEGFGKPDNSGPVRPFVEFEESASTFRPQKCADRVHICDDVAFVIIP